MKVRVFSAIAVASLLLILGCSYYTSTAVARTDSWVDLQVLTFDGNNILFELKITVVGNHADDQMWVRSESPSGSGGVTVEVWRGISYVVYSGGTNTTMFSYRYSYNNSYYEAEPKLWMYLLFPYDKHDLTLFFSSSWNMSIDTHPSVCNVPSQNYQGTFQITPSSSSEFKLQLEIQHSTEFETAVAGTLYSTIIALYGLTISIAVFIYLKRKSLDSIPNIIPVPSAIIFFVPAFEIAFNTLKTPLPLTFSDILLIPIVPLNAAILAFFIWLHYFGKGKKVS